MDDKIWSVLLVQYTKKKNRTFLSLGKINWNIFALIIRLTLKITVKMWWNVFNRKVLLGEYIAQETKI